MPKAKAAKISKVIPSIDELNKAGVQTREKYGQAGKTKKGYGGYLERGKKILAGIVQARKAAEQEGKVFTDGIVASELAKAFNNPPNKWSSKALELILIQKCVHEGCGKSTMDGMHAAYAKHWDEMDGEKYAGEAYRCDERTGVVSGNPARSHLINTFRRVMNTKAAAKGVAATRNHAEAMTVEDIEAMVVWSEKECPKSMVDLVLFGTDQNAEHTMLVIKHTFLRGFLSSGFTLWTRNNELCQLQHGDLTWNCHGLAPDRTERFKVHLENRKGWQKKAGYDPHPTDNIYDIYPQPVHAMDMHYHLPVWISVCRSLLGREFEQNDFPKREYTHDMVQSLIQEAAAAAGVAKTFTTHSLRRGGAQYRFMWAEGKQRWSLTIVRWWGGWAEDERVDTLMKYLMDSLQSYETGHGNALCPSRLEPAKSFMSDHSLDQPVTTNDFRRFAVAMISANRQVVDTMRIIPELTLAHMRQMTFPGTESQGNALQPFSCQSTASPDPPMEGISTQDHRPQKSLKAERSAPIPGVMVPDIPKHGEDLFMAVVKQWEEGDPSQGLTMPLKDWPVEWYTGSMRLVTGTKRSNRKLVADEYER
ncbi:hypothetical protein BDP27DRAFT_1382450 [Rhodocollybia butyracea]|uniref:Integrase n=1 Tax=Rhodocollybia butyracea TaxID=206335 RepID=A0A9P5PXL9_9AGAR|nr:hypothetical protein BDP27DRAFT_1382450 [Rhodocollybia butyracea]